MLTVWSVCWGAKYGDEDVQILQGMVARHMKQPHRFRCLSDRPIEGVDTTITPVSWPGWWQKLALFLMEQGPALYLDLDVVIVGPLDDLVCHNGISMPANWAQSGHGGCQSSVMSWTGDYSWLPGLFDPKELSRPENGNFGWYGAQRLWGDQEFITSHLGDPGKGEVIPMPGIKSYKYHCGDGVPQGSRVVCFHGDPKPAKVVYSWVVEARQR